MTHAIQTGILVDNVVLPNTRWVIRDSRAWWTPGQPGCHLRSSYDVTRIVGHWTGGKPHEGPDAGRRVVSNMKARKRPDGSPLDVGIHFVISWDGMVFQTMDLGLKAVHVGSRNINETSIGVECCWPGTYAQAQKLGVDGHMLTVDLGRKLDVLRPSYAMLESWRRLVDTLTTAPDVEGPTAMRVPRNVPATTKRFTAREMRSYRGIMEHWHVRGTEKLDAAGLLCGVLNLPSQ